MRRAFVISFAAAALGATAGFARADTAGDADPEVALAAVYREVGAARLDDALAQLDALIARAPNFRLAHLVKGDVLLARAQAIATLGEAPGAPAASVDDLRDEARVRRAHELTPLPTDRVPAALLKLSPAQKHALVVDVERARLMVYENTGDVPRLVADFYASHGKRGATKEKQGDQRTPTGVYDVSGFLPGRALADLYGAGAFPLSYPNKWDEREGRDGYGIWLHGTPQDTWARPPRASDGCVVLANADLEQLRRYVAPGATPVVIGTGVEFVAADTWREARDELERAVEAWRTDWESRDTERYLTHYAKGFRADGHDLESWSKHKRRVNAGKKFITVGVDELTVLRDPERADLAVATFVQDYRSSNIGGTMRKRQYWVREDGAWKIAWEGAASEDRGRPMN